jgi:hypothetical protein
MLLLRHRSKLSSSKQTDMHAEVGKMTIEHLRPKHKPSTRHVGDIVYIKKKCWIERLHFFLDRWKRRGIGLDVFLH